MIAITEKIKEQIIMIWDKYASSNKNVLDTKGKTIENIDDTRAKAIEEIKKIINSFFEGQTNLYEFKSSLDSYNKRNNLWGFTATKGQMFFNLLTRSNENNIDEFSSLLKKCISQPKDLVDALIKIEDLETVTRNLQEKIKDKRKVANPSSTGYFLSYFWQIHDRASWPIMYTSLINSFRDLGLWEDRPTQKEDYETFFNLNEEIKKVIRQHSKKEISNWDVEHAFWNYSGNPHQAKQKTESVQKVSAAELPIELAQTKDITLKANFDLADYLLPRIANLVTVGQQSEKSSSAKGYEFEKMVAEIFKFLDFDVESLGQGKGRNPDAILKFREENTAFIVDAKAYGNGYTLGLDDRAIKEYINFHCPRLQKEGFKKIGFIIVSNSFRSGFDSFINDVTWNTDIKRFILLTSEALLYLFAYKMKDKLSLNIIIERLLSCGNLIEANNIIEEFEDV
jgi:hypothetical protein